MCDTTGGGAMCNMTRGGAMCDTTESGASGLAFRHTCMDDTSHAVLPAMRDYPVTIAMP